MADQRPSPPHQRPGGLVGTGPPPAADLKLRQAITFVYVTHDQNSARVRGRPVRSAACAAHPSKAVREVASRGRGLPNLGAIAASVTEWRETGQLTVAAWATTLWY